MLKKTFLFASLITIGSITIAAPLQLKTLQDKASYAIGANIGNSIKNQPQKINSTALIAGLKDVLNDKKPLLSKEEMMQAFKALQEKSQAKAKAEGEKNLKAGQVFLKKQARKTQVKKTSSGLLYKILKRGKGQQPVATDTVEVNYKGTLINGTEFDSSYSRGKPVTFPLNRVIPGWTEGVQLMKVGSKYRFYVPSNLAYGEMSPSPKIPPNSTLIFDIELLKIKKEAKG